MTSEFVKPVRRMIIRWVVGPPFMPIIRSAVPICPRVPSLRIRRRMIRRHNILSPELCLFNDIQ